MIIDSTKNLKQKVRDWVKTSDDYQEFIKTRTLCGIEITSQDIIDHYYDNFEDKNYHYTVLANRFIDEYYNTHFDRIPHKGEDLVHEVTFLNEEIEDALISNDLIYENERFIYFAHGYNEYDQEDMIYFADYELNYSDRLYTDGRANLNGVVANFGDGSLYREDLYGVNHVVVIDEIMDYRFIPLWRYLSIMNEILDPNVITDDILKNESNFRVFINIVLSNPVFLDYFNSL